MGHPVPEEVDLRVYAYHSGELKHIGGPASFHYASDSAHQMAVFLLGSVEDPSSLNDLELICRERFQLTPDVQANLDDRLTSAFRTLSLPPCWNMMGTGQNGNIHAERLLHFSARLGLIQLTRHFLTLPGSLTSLSSRNHEGYLPEDVARKLEFHDLANLLQYYREQETVYHSKLHSVLPPESEESPLVVTTNSSLQSHDFECNILDVEKIQKVAHRMSNCLTEPANMKELHLTKNGCTSSEVSRTEEENQLHCNVDKTSLPTCAPRSHSPKHQVRVLEDNLRRLRDIHEGIQRLRELNTKQIVVHSLKAPGTSRLSNSCPALYLTSFLTGDDASLREDRLVSMRNIEWRKASLSSNSRSLDSAFTDSVNVKIHINNITPTASENCLNSVLSAEEVYPEKHPRSGVNYCRSTNIGGTASSRLAKRTNKKTPVRRQSWSSLGASISSDSTDEKYVIQRRWSLSSLDSDAEETFWKPTGSSLTFPVKACSLDQSSSPSEMPEISTEKLRSLSSGGCEESFFSKSGKQSSSVPSMCNISAKIKENVEPDKAHSAGSLSATAKNFLVSFKNHPLQKSLSTPSIAVDDSLTEKAKQEALNRQSLCAMHPLCDVSDSAQTCPTPEENVTTLQQLSLAGLLRENQLHCPTADSDEEKPFEKRKKRSSIFFRKRPHKAKDGKKTAHQFVLWSGLTTVCDVCLKPFVKKQALKCENCLVVVHDSSCKEQVLDCNKFKIQKIPPKPNNVPLNKDQNMMPSFNLPSTANQRNSGQQTQSSKERGSSTLQNMQFQSSLSKGSSMAKSSSASLSKMISEESDIDGGGELGSNMMDTNSASMESLDEETNEISDLEDNQVLRLIDDEPETWNATADKKIIKKLSDREVKRQEAIYELIITEKHHCLTLQIMQKVYYQGLIKELNMSRDLVEKLLPSLNELLDFHKAFLSKLRERQSESPVIEQIADILQDQFYEQKAEQMKTAYGHFCSQHIEALNLYKDLSKSDRKFQNFMKKCSLKRRCKTRGIPECLLLVTQRITKYRLVLESLIKAAKDNKEEQVTLIKVLNHLKNIISQVESQVAEKEKEIRLLEVYNKMDPKATIFYRGKKFKKSDLLSSSQKLRLEGPLTWRSPRGKTIEVLGLMLTDYIFFLQENNQKYCFASLENKPGIVSLQKLLVRKKAGQDSKGMYLISSNPSEPEMLELFCRTSKDQKTWMDAVREAVEHCPGEDEGVPSESEEEKKLEAARGARIKELTELLHERDLGLSHICEERMRILADMLEVVGIDSECYENTKYSHLFESENTPETKELILSAINKAAHLANNLYVSGCNLSRSVSSAGEHQSEAYVSPLLPKRAETFGGFDSPSKDQTTMIKVPVLKKKLLHLKEFGELSNILPSKDKFEMGPECADSSEYPLLDKESRKTSTFSPPPTSQGNMSQKDVASELSKLTTTPLLVTQGKEQLIQISELAHHLNTLCCMVTHLSTTVESMRVQIAQANDKIAKLTKEKEGRDRRSVYRPEHQLEELRNLQKQLNHDRAVYQQEKSQHEMEIKTEREELERLQEQLKAEQVDVTHQRELLYRKLDALQKQGIILSPSHTVVNLNSCTTRDTDIHKDDTRLACDSASSTVEYLQHRRTLSYDLHHDSTEQPSSLPLTTNIVHSVHRSDTTKVRPSLNLSSPPLSGKTMPLHLSSSATNLQKRPSMSVQSVKQQLPLKLANTNAFGATNGASSSSSVIQGPQQVLPLKLALGSLPSSIPSLVSSTGNKNSAPKRSHSAASSPSSTLTAPVHVRGGSSPALVQTSYPANSTATKCNKTENSILMKLASDKLRNKKEKDNNEEIFC